jgi:hypothetical protein
VGFALLHGGAAGGGQHDEHGGGGNAHLDTHKEKRQGGLPPLPTILPDASLEVELDAEADATRRVERTQAVTPAGRAEARREPRLGEIRVELPGGALHELIGDADLLVSNRLNTSALTVSLRLSDNLIG